MLDDKNDSVTPQELPTNETNDGVVENTTPIETSVDLATSSSESDVSGTATPVATPTDGSVSQPSETTTTPFDPFSASTSEAAASVVGVPLTSTPAAQPASTSPAALEPSLATTASSSNVPTPGSSTIGSGPTPESIALATPPSKKKLPKFAFISIIIAAALVLLGGSSALAYNFWYQNPDKVVADAIVGAVTARTVSLTGEMNLKTDDYKMKLEVSGRNSTEGNLTVGVKVQYETDEFDISLSGDGFWSVDGDLYFKLNDVRGAVDSIEKQYGEDTYAFLDDVIAKYDGKWVKVGKDDLGDVSDELADTQKCFGDLWKQLDEDASFRKTVENDTMKLYKEHPFVVVGDKLGARDINGVASLGYVLDDDSEAADAFFTALADTEFGKKVEACNKDVKLEDFISDDMKDEEDDADSSSEIWISRFGHQITEINATSNKDGMEGDLVVNPIFNANEAVEVPSDALKFGDLVKDVEAAYNAYLEKYYAEYYDTYYSDTYDYSGSTSTSESTSTSGISSLFN